MANNSVEGLSVLQLVAVSGCIPSKQVTEAKKQLSVGEHKVSGLFRINAVIKKGEDVEKPCIASLPTKEIICALLSNMGSAQRGAFLRNLANGEIVTHGYTEKDLESEWEAIAQTTMKVSSGATTIKGGCVEVSEVPVNEEVVEA